MYLQLHDPAFLAVASGGTPALDLFFSATKALDSRITFSRGSSGTFINENGNVVGKTPSTTSSITPSTTSIGSQVTVTVVSGSVVGWAVGQAISLIVDTDGQDDPDAGELWLLGDIVSSTLTTLTFTVTSRTATAGSATSWTLGYRGARFTHNPSTLASLGLLVEESRTNLLLRSEEFNDAAWPKTRSTVSANAAVAPDGTTTADKLIEDTSANTHFCLQNVAIGANATYTLTVYLKAAERGFAQVWMANAATADRFQADINLSTGEVFPSAQGGTPFTGGTASSQQLSNGWWRLVLTATTTGGAINLQTRIHISTSLGVTSYAGNGTSGILLWGAQLEAGAFATSYIPTTSATVTRAADVATMTGTNFSSWYNQSQGAVSIDGQIPNISGSYGVYSIDDGTTNNAFPCFHNSNSIFLNSRIAASNVFSSSFSTSGTFKAVLAFASSNYASCVNGASVSTGSASVPSVDRLRIGFYNNQYTNGTISRIRFFRRRLPNANLQTLTT